MEGSVSYQEGIDRPLEYNLDGYGGDEGVVYLNKEDEMILSGDGSFYVGSPENLKYSSNPFLASATEDNNRDVFLSDLSRVYHFSVTIEGFPVFISPECTMANSNGEFLAVRNINFNYTSYENMSIPVAIFGDFPLLNKKRVSTISLSCYDEDSSSLEYTLRSWENSCFPKGRYVAYMEDIIRKFDYRGYGVDGREVLRCSFYVIPSGTVAVPRDYNSNEAKVVNFSLVCVGDGATCASGPGKAPSKTRALFADASSSYEYDRFDV